MVDTPKTDAATVSDEAVNGVQNTGVNPEDAPLAEKAAAQKTTTDPKKAAAKKAMTFKDYIAAGEKPPKEMVTTPKQWKEYLLAFPRVKVIAPLQPGEKKGVATETCKLNGCEITFKKGYFVELPEPMANIVMAHYEIQDSASVELTNGGNKAESFELTN